MDRRGGREVIAYVLRRLLYVIPIVFGVALVVFLIFDSELFGDPAGKLLGKHADAASIARLRHDLGYDDPIWERFGRYLGDMVTFDFGRSRSYKVSIREMILRGVGPSLSITLPAYLIASLIAISLSLICAAFRGRVLDRAILVAAVALMSISSLVYIIFGQYLLAYRLDLFPIAGYERGPQGFYFVLLPIVIFVFLTLGPDMRFYRAALLEEVRQDYVRTARAKGVSERKVLFAHVLRNGFVPILTQVVVTLPFLFLGSLLLERFFQIPGLGGMVVEGILTNDMPVIRAMTFLFALLLIVAGIVTDVLYTIVDPRMRLS